MDVERVERQLIAASVRGDLLGGSVCKRIRAANDESFERKPRIGRWTAERVIHRNERQVCARLGTPRCYPARVARRQRLDRLRLRCKPDCGRPNAQFQARDRSVFHPPLSKDAVLVVGLNPLAQERGRHRQAHHSLVHGFEFHATEPAGEHFLAEFETQPFLDALPTIRIDTYGGVLLLWKHGLNPTNEARAKLLPCRATGRRNAH